MIKAKLNHRQNTVRQDKNKVVVILLDGGDWRVINNLLAKNKLPNFKALIERGRSGTLSCVHTHSTPNMASIFTGALPERHGIKDHFYFDKKSRELKQSLVSRMKVKPLWKLLEDKFSFCILSFVETPEALKTDNVMVGCLYNVMNVAKFNNLKITNKHKLNYLKFLYRKKLVYPKNILKDFDLIFLKDTKQEMMRRKLFLKFNSPISNRMSNKVINSLGMEASGYGGKADILMDGLNAVFSSNISAKFIFDYDAITKNMALHFLNQKKSDVYLIYFMGADTFGHMYYMDGWHLKDPNNYQEQLYKYYEVLDDYLGEIVGSTDKNTTFLILSDSGVQDIKFDDYENSIKLKKDKTSKWYGKKHVPPHISEGIFIINGPGITLDTKKIKATMMDIAPTIFHILGLDPRKHQFDGQIIKDVFKNKILIK